MLMRTRTGRGPDAGRTIDFEETDADRTRAWPFLPGVARHPHRAAPLHRVLQHHVVPPPAQAQAVRYAPGRGVGVLDVQALAAQRRVPRQLRRGGAQVQQRA
eukprot:gene14514-biopygen18641